MPAKQLFAHGNKDKYDLLHTIPNPNGIGHLICGAQAGQRFYKLADRVIDFEPSLAGRINPENIRKAVIDAFVRRMLKEHREIDITAAEIILRDAAEKSASSLETTQHFLPCILFPHGGPDEFDIGPVTFTRRIKFFKEKKQLFRRSVEENIAAHIAHVNEVVAQGFSCERAYTAEQSRDHVRRLRALAIKTYRSYPWIAQIQINRCDHGISRELAVKAVQTALNIIRVILGSHHTERLRLAWSQEDALQTAHMWADSKKTIHVSLGKRAFGPVGVDNWHEALTQRGNYLERIGSVLESLVDPQENYHLQTRFIDAINWFGDAATDTEPTASLVKYVAAIERLLFGKFDERRKHTTIFATRVKLIFDIFGCDTPGGNAYEDATKIYKARSALLHGASSPRDTKEHKLAKLAEELSRLCILCAAQLYPMMLSATKNPGPAELEKAISGIEKEGLAWFTNTNCFDHPSLAI